MELDVQELVVGLPLVGLDDLVLPLELILGHELPPSRRCSADRRFQVLDGLVNRNLPCSPSNTQAGMTLCPSAGTSAAAGRVGPGVSGCLSESGAAPDRACLGGFGHRDVGVRD